MLDVCPISIAFLTQNISMLPKKLSSWALLEAYYQMHSLKAEMAIFRNSLRRLQACLNREQNRVLANLNSVKDCRKASYEMVRHCTKLTLLHPLGCHCFETQVKGLIAEQGNSVMQTGERPPPLDCHSIFLFGFEAI